MFRCLLRLGQQYCLKPSHPQSRGLTPQAEKSELALKNTSSLISKIGKTIVNAYFEKELCICLLPRTTAVLTGGGVSAGLAQPSAVSGVYEGLPVWDHCQCFFFYSAFPWVSLPQLLNEFENTPIVNLPRFMHEQLSFQIYHSSLLLTHLRAMFWSSGIAKSGHLALSCGYYFCFLRSRNSLEPSFHVSY